MSIKEYEDKRARLSKEINKKINRIDASHLTDYQLRDLNDEINKLMVERKQTEVDIFKLNGPDYGASSTTTHEYQYFGRAKELPGAKDMKPVTSGRKQPKKARLCDDYYGLNDTLTEELLPIQTGSDVTPIGKIQLPDPKDLERYLMDRKKQQLSEYLG